MNPPGSGTLIAGFRPGVSVVGMLVLVIGALVPFIATAGSQPASLEIDPLFCDLGYLSLDTPLNSEVHEGPTRVRVLSSVDWQIEILMPVAPRRVDDSGQPLGLRRPIPPSPIPEGLFALRPCIVAAGPPSERWHELEVDWREVGSALERILDPLTPPGTYQASLLARLVDREGRALTDCVGATVRFDIAGWVRMSEEIPPVEITFDGGDLVGQVFESCVTSILMTGNTAWQLDVAQAGMLTSEDGQTEIPRASFTVSVPRAGPGDESQAAQPGTLALDGNPLTIYAEDSAPSGDEGFLEIPVVVRVDSDEPLPAGRYRLTLVFEARAQEPLP